MCIEYRNYSIKRKDDKCWEVEKLVKVTAQRDIKKPGTDEIARKEGEEYTTTVLVGFYGDVGKALSGVVKDMAGKNCKTIGDLATQIKIIRNDLSVLLEQHKAKK